MAIQAIRELCDAYAMEYLEGSSPVPDEFLPPLGKFFKGKVESIAAQVIAHKGKLSSAELPFALYGAVVKLRQDAQEEANGIIARLGDEMASRIEAFGEELSGRTTPASTLTQFLKENFPGTPVVIAALR